MNKLDKDYHDLLKDILENGTRKSDRTGTGTISVFGRQIRHKMSDGFPLLTTKKMYTKGIITELLWFLKGDTNIKYLLENNCNIWNGDAYKNFIKNPGYKSENAADLLGSQAGQLLICPTQEDFINKIKTDDEFAKKWGDLGPVYGKQWRSWEYRKNYPDGTYTGVRGEIDQIENLINDLKTNPDSRRLMVNAWNVGELDQMTLPPCHYGFQVYTRELDLDERAKLHPNPEMFYDINGTFSIGDSIENSNFPDKDWLHKKFDICGIPKRAISLMWNQRSVDTFLGLPFNIASYGLLLEIIAKAVNMVPDELIGNLGDVHLYSNHIEQATEQIGRELRIDERVCMCYENPSLDLTRIQEGMSDYELEKVCDEFSIPKRTREAFELPKLNINTEFWPTEGGECGIGPLHGDIGILIDNMQITDFEIIDYKSHGVIKASLSN
jgi:thymidylate synthase